LQTPFEFLRSGKLLIGASVAVFAVVLFRCSWITEDAYIMFRTIDNVIHGYGLTWNVTERVQAYTCPLWFGLLLPFHAMTGEYYFTAMAVSWLVSLTTVWLVCFRIAPALGNAIVAAAILTSSKGFIDYSTSGLENPLTHLLLCVFCLLYYRKTAAQDGCGLFILVFVASLGMVNRLDTALLYLPALLWSFWNTPKRAGIAAACFGAAPLLVWEAFSVVYYGFLFPNTAYAKLNLGLSSWDMAMQGLAYYSNAAVSDPLTLVAIGAALIVCVGGRRWQEAPLALGILLYLMYIVRVGGDYMSMRFFTAPLLVAVVILARTARFQDFRFAAPAVAIAIGLSLFMPRSPWRSGTEFGTARLWGEVDSNGIADERGYWHRRFGLLAVMERRRSGRNGYPMVVERRREQHRHAAPEVVVRGGIGHRVFEQPAHIHVIDIGALATPLLAHLPINEDCRVGHYFRQLPAGYLKTVETGESHFKDPKLAIYYDKLRLITSGEIWDSKRWRAIWEMNTGQLRHLVDHEFYRRPDPTTPRNDFGSKSYPWDKRTRTTAE
jgi:arabinofuranosyltransferase